MVRAGRPITEPSDGPLSAGNEKASERLRAIAADLSAAGLSIHLHHTRAGLDLTATLHQPGHRETDVLVDEDGYTELRYWADPDATPAQIAGTITSALAVVAADLAKRPQLGQARLTDPALGRRPPHRAVASVTGYDGAVTERAGDDLMTGPPDRMAEQGRSPDSARPRESDRVDAELRERMERLLPNHPSSPYNEDGSRRPPPPDLSAHELPIPGDPDYQEADSTTDHSSEREGVADQELMPDSEADRSLATEDQPHISPDGSWEWMGYPLTAEQSRSADHRVETCKQAEGRDMNDGYGQRGITPAMRRIEAQLEQGELVPDTEKYALKTADRFKEKLARMILEEPDADLDELIPRIADGIRYTFCFPDSGYTSGVMGARDCLTSAGFQLYEQKNAWADETKSYKGVNSAWMDHDSGLLFEVQMHTAASWAAKQESHREYEILESRSATADEKARARQRQDQIFATVPIPGGAAEIPTYRKEGW